VNANTELTTDVVIIGLGLVGPFIAGILAKRGYNVIVVERRPDPDQEGYCDTRMLHMTLARRGLSALQKHGLAESVEKLATKVYGRRIHAPKINADYFPYSFDKSNCLYALSREDLNKEMIKYARQFSNIQILFNHKCNTVDLDKRQVVLTNATTNVTAVVFASVIIGADGINSCIRESIKNKTNSRVTRDIGTFGYKHISIPRDVVQKIGLRPDEVHVWPHGNIMMIGFTGIDGNLSCAMVMPMDGSDSFESFNDTEKISAFFVEKCHLPEDAVDELVNQFSSNAIARAPVIDCERWYYGGSALLIGDSSQCTVPWYGQGVNKAFQDCILLEQILEEKKEWQKVFPAFQQKAKPASDALIRLSVNHLYDLRQGVTELLFVEKKQVEIELSTLYPEQFKSTYEMVAFSLLPFEIVEKISLAQDKIILDELKLKKGSEKINFPNLMAKIMQLYDDFGGLSQLFGEYRTTEPLELQAISAKEVSWHTN
jgi:kynurenine 3-monooxygenase